MSEEEHRDRLAEQLSALVDDELPREQRAFLMRRLDHDADARLQVARYYLMRDALQRNLPPQPSTDLVERVRAGLADEPVHHVQRGAARQPAARDWRRPAFGGLIAASVAAVTVLWWQGGAPPDAGTGPTAGSGEPATEVASPAGGERSIGGTTVRPVTLGDSGGLPWPDSDRGTAGTTREQSFDPVPDAMPSRLHRFMIDHAEQAESDYPGSMLHQVRVPQHGDP
ncbi:MAG: sigma-E factor negative regulatory protein [Halorhodospira halophila]|uniref:sigma-E factor negative regulatory protein n=1 Tax=Halorhodospira TaxID=85108 RepID=UPI001914494A|nr:MULTISPECIES: sigma-E factor negative regulatory protein [Halorhodospira]MBK5936909.1 hypothetical protein [Halorhodospira halophila]MBK5942354.1 hypothetical protein [Halorhodospira halophila]MCC3750305.1 sigma-E factor negative regulatory protein [Halorhodospira halophila]MCG5528136.1 sigma-E factor negative regulatory protein [Halorhodospira halophila]MCG5531905.1 sigma-E factor negative regulatory protein [Halorhodospira sp. 9621]